MAYRRPFSTLVRRYKFQQFLTCLLVALLCVLIWVKFRCMTKLHFHALQTVQAAHERRMNDQVHVIKTSDNYPNILLVCVNSDPSRPDRRRLIRQTWGSKVRFAQYGLRVLFYVGVSQDKGVVRALRAEQDTYGDIIQFDFIESYRNLTRKGLAMMNHASDLYMQADKLIKYGHSDADSPNHSGFLYYLKIDDDMLMNTFSLLERVHNMVAQHDTRDIIFCFVHSPGIVFRGGKYAVSKDKYSANTYPQFCSGSAYFFSHDVVHKLVSVAHYLDEFPLEDVHITGFLRHLVDIPLRYGNDAYNVLSKHPERNILGASWNKYLFTHFQDEGRLGNIWQTLNSNAIKCQHPFAI